MSMISVTGVGSGLPLKELKDNLVKAEGEVPLERLDTKEIENYKKLTALGNFKKSLDDLKTAVFKLKTEDSFQLRKVTSNQNDLDSAPYVTATATGSAALMSYDIKVIELAKAHKVKTQSTYVTTDTVLGTGSITFTVGQIGNQSTHTVDLGENEQTLAGIKNAINALTDTTGITATIVTEASGVNRLYIASVDTGEDQEFTVSTTTLTGDLSSLNTVNLDIVETAVNGHITIDNANIYPATNIVSNVIEGMTFTLLREDALVTTKLSVTVDNSGAETVINDFMTAYNKMVDVYNEITAFQDKRNKKNIEDILKDTDKDNKDDKDKSAKSKFSTGALFADNAIRNIMDSMQTVITTRVINLTGNITKDNHGYGSLAELGIVLDRDGKLVQMATSATTNQETGISGYILGNSSAKLTEAMTINPTNVISLFIGADDDSFDGLGARLEEAINPYILYNGAIDQRIAALNEDNKAIDKQRTKLEEHLAKFEERLRLRFTALDLLVSKLKSTGERTNNMLEAMTKANNR